MSLNVIGAGLGRTGTASLKLALDMLGVGPCYHMSEVFKNPSCAPLWERAADGAPDWDTIFEGYGATVDYPACTFWRELSERYPQAKVILTVRDPARWFESTQETIMSPRLIEFMRPTPFGKMLSKTVWDTMGGRVHDRDFMIEHFERHAAQVRAALPAERLLVYEVKQGWGPLCSFLGVDAPDTDFPRVNSREETAQALASILDGGAAGVSDEALGRAAERIHPNED